MHEIWSVDSKENLYNCCHQMSSFKAKMQQIRFRLGLRPRPRWGSLQRSPRLPSWISGGLLLGGGRELHRGPRVYSYATGLSDNNKKTHRTQQHRPFVSLRAQHSHLGIHHVSSLLVFAGLPRNRDVACNRDLLKLYQLQWPSVPAEKTSHDGATRRGAWRSERHEAVVEWGKEWLGIFPPPAN